MSGTSFWNVKEYGLDQVHVQPAQEAYLFADDRLFPYQVPGFRIHAAEYFPAPRKSALEIGGKGSALRLPSINETPLSQGYIQSQAVVNIGYAPPLDLPSSRHFQVASDGSGGNDTPMFPQTVPANVSQPQKEAEFGMHQLPDNGEMVPPSFPHSDDEEKEAAYQTLKNDVDSLEATVAKIKDEKMDIDIPEEKPMPPIPQVVSDLLNPTIGLAANHVAHKEMENKSDEKPGEANESSQPPPLEDPFSWLHHTPDVEETLNEVNAEEERKKEQEIERLISELPSAPTASDDALRDRISALASNSTSSNVKTGTVRPKDLIKINENKQKAQHQMMLDRKKRLDELERQRKAKSTSTALQQTLQAVVQPNQPSIVADMEAQQLPQLGNAEATATPLSSTTYVKPQQDLIDVPMNMTFTNPEPKPFPISFTNGTQSEGLLTPNSSPSNPASSILAPDTQSVAGSTSLFEQESVSENLFPQQPIPKPVAMPTAPVKKNKKKSKQPVKTYQDVYRNYKRLPKGRNFKTMLTPADEDNEMNVSESSPPKHGSQSSVNEDAHSVGDSNEFIPYPRSNPLNFALESKEEAIRYIQDQAEKLQHRLQKTVQGRQLLSEQGSTTNATSVQNEPSVPVPVASITPISEETVQDEHMLGGYRSCVTMTEILYSHEDSSPQETLTNVSQLANQIRQQQTNPQLDNTGNEDIVVVTPSGQVMSSVDVGRMVMDVTQGLHEITRRNASSINEAINLVRQIRDETHQICNQAATAAHQAIQHVEQESIADDNSTTITDSSAFLADLETNEIMRSHRHHARAQRTVHEYKSDEEFHAYTAKFHQELHRRTEMERANYAQLQLERQETLTAVISGMVAAYNEARQLRRDDSKEEIVFRANSTRALIYVSEVLAVAFTYLQLPHETPTLTRAIIANYTEEHLASIELEVLQTFYNQFLMAANTVQVYRNFIYGSIMSLLQEIIDSPAVPPRTQNLLKRISSILRPSDNYQTTARYAKVASSDFSKELVLAYFKQGYVKRINDATQLETRRQKRRYNQLHQRLQAIGPDANTVQAIDLAMAQHLIRQHNQRATRPLPTPMPLSSPPHVHPAPVSHPDVMQVVPYEQKDDANGSNEQQEVDNFMKRLKAKKNSGNRKNLLDRMSKDLSSFEHFGNEDVYPMAKLMYETLFPQAEVPKTFQLTQKDLSFMKDLIFSTQRGKGYIFPVFLAALASIIRNRISSNATPATLRHDADIYLQMMYSLSFEMVFDK